MPTSNQSNVLYSNELFKQYIMQISTGLVWKNVTEANANESKDLTDLYLIELFISANRGLLNFDIIKSFPRAILQTEFASEFEIELYAADKTKIPVNRRNDLVKAYALALTSKDPITGHPVFYVESNDYYRTLMGLPSKDDVDNIYNDDSRWDTHTPIHQLSRVDRLEMEAEGILDKLYLKYPSKEYIKYLGKKSIEPFKARVADRFELLYYEKSVSDTLTRDFVDVYNSARQMVLSIYYNRSLNKSNPLYENFLALSTLFMTIQTMQHKYLKVDITRDFYDIESLKLIYDSYGVPFYDDIPLEYHRKIVKNINRLISYKGSSQVFFDLFDIFDIATIDIYSYFLTKTHIMDSNGNPSFILKQKTDDLGNLVYDDDGNPVYLYDDDGNPILDESNYKIQFARTKIYDDPALSISDEANRADYDMITSQDPYWINDGNLISKITGENFNYLESKYIGVQTVFDLMRITYESAYIFRLITDNKELTNALKFKWSDLGISCSIFEAFIYLAVLYCKKSGYEGIIRRKDEADLHGIPSIMDTLGFDYKNSVSILRSAIANNDYIANNTEINDLISKIKLTNIDSIDTVYSNIVKLRDIIMDGYMNAKSLEEYRAYRELYNALMISEEIESVYSKVKKDEHGNTMYDENGKPILEVYETFIDVLDDTSPELMERYLLLHDDNSALDSEITIVIDQIESVITNLKYMSLSIGIGSSNLIDSLFKILTFFKSAKAELIGYNILYTIVMRGINFFKLMDFIHSFNEESEVVEYNDIVDITGIISEMLYHKYDLIKIKETFPNSLIITYIEEYIHSMDTILEKVFEIISLINKNDPSTQLLIDISNIEKNISAKYDSTYTTDTLFQYTDSMIPTYFQEYIHSMDADKVLDLINFINIDNPCMQTLVDISHIEKNVDRKTDVMGMTDTLFQYSNGKIQVVN